MGVEIKISESGEVLARSNVVMEVDKKDLRDQLMLQLSSDISASLREAKIGYKGITRTENGVSVRLSDIADAARAKADLQKLQQPLTSGLRVSGLAVHLFNLATEGEVLNFTFSDQGLDAKIAIAIGQSLKIVENRINALGTSEPSIQQQGKDRIAIQLPGIQNPDQVKNVIGRTAKLTFQLLCQEQPTGANQNPPQECKALPVKDQPQQILWVQTSSRATVDGEPLPMLTQKRASPTQHERRARLVRAILHRNHQRPPCHARRS